MYIVYVPDVHILPNVLQVIYVEQPLLYGSILFQNETSTNCLKWLGWGGVVSITFDSEGL